MSEEQERKDCSDHAHYGNLNAKLLGQTCVPCMEYDNRRLTAALSAKDAELGRAREDRDERMAKLEAVLKQAVGYVGAASKAYWLDEAIALLSQPAQPIEAETEEEFQRLTDLNNFVEGPDDPPAQPVEAGKEIDR